MKEERAIIIAGDAGISIRSFADISNALGECLGSGGLILTESDLAAAFFDLRSGLAGELFQKFINYKVRIAIVLPNPKAHGERFAELAFEHASHDMICFFGSENIARAWLVTCDL